MPCCRRSPITPGVDRGNLVSPAAIGRKMSLSPIMVLLFLVFWGWMWGIAGAALAGADSGDAQAQHGSLRADSARRGAARR